MSEPIIADKKPCILDLEAGVYFWCACGRSSKQPFCDGSHAGTEFQPLKFELSQKTRLALCQCKHSNQPPKCDGQHLHLA